MGLFPTFEMPNIVELTEEPKPEYSYSIHFDFDKKDIVLDSGGKVVIADGKDAWLQWCVKALLTERSTMLGYTSAVGAEMEYALSREDKPACELALEKTIRETLMADPGHRTLEVRDFEYAWGVDDIQIMFTITGADGYTGKLSVTL